MKPEEYNKDRFLEKYTENKDVVFWRRYTCLVKHYQMMSAGELVSDGKAGTKTEAHIDETFGLLGDGRANPKPPKFTIVHPLPLLPNGRTAVATSHHWVVNKDRAPGSYTKSNGKPYEGHQGTDFMYAEPGRVCNDSQTNGKFWIPTNTRALAVADSTVTRVSSSKTSGHAVELTLRDGTRVVYRHLSAVYVRTGEKAIPGKVLGTVGGTLPDGLWHLHFEVYPANTDKGYYDDVTINAAPWLANAQYIPWKEHWNE